MMGFTLTHSFGFDELSEGNKDFSVPSSVIGLKTFALGFQEIGINFVLFMGPSLVVWLASFFLSICVCFFWLIVHVFAFSFSDF